MLASTDQHLFETIVGNLSDGIYVIQDNRTVFLNERCGEIFGYSSAERLIGRDMYAARLGLIYWGSGNRGNSFNE